MVAFLFGPLAIVQGIYAKHFGLPLTTIAAILLAGRLFDAITDPLIGYWSDHYYARTGSRKPFVVAGALLFILSSYFLYVPATNIVSPTYFLVWFLAFYLAFTLFQIPHLAWGNELVSHSKEKNTIFSLRMLADSLGKTLFYAIPLLPFFKTTEFTPETLRWSVLIASVLMLPLLYICIKTVPNGQRADLLTKEKDRLHHRVSPRLLLYAAWSNKPFLLFTTTLCLSNIGMGMWYGLMFIYTDTYLNLGDKLPQVFLVSVGISIVSLGFWYKLANHLGKKVVWGLGNLCYATALVGIACLAPEQSSFLPLLLMISFIYFGLTALGATGPSLLSDIIDYGTLKSGQDMGASYFSIYLIILKAVGAISASAGLAIAGWYGFDVTATAHTTEGTFGLRLGALYLPVLFILLSTLLITRIPINARRHAIVQRRLDAKILRVSVQKELENQASY
jgi:Na+/melibiose symporter-like transporter